MERTMDLMRVIRERRSIGKVKASLPEREKIEQILEAGTWAPNHYKVEPWRFFVLTGEARARLGEAMAQAVLEKHADPGSDAARALAEGARRKPLQAPVIIAVACDAPATSKVMMVENLAAVAAAMQNMLLVAHELGLGAKLRTGDEAYQAKVREFFGLGEGCELAGFIYVGYPDQEAPQAQRTPHEQKTTWWGDEEGEYSGGA